MRLQRASTGEIRNLGDHCLLGAGGEARIFTWPSDTNLVAKVWHKPSVERAAKLEAMLANPPVNPMAAHSHCAIAWPLDALHLPGQPRFKVGFLMPRVIGLRPLVDFSNPKTRREQCPLFSYFYLHRTARNLASAVRALHERGYVIGDLNESNILVAETALVTVVDTDSFQVWDADRGVMHRCRVGKPDLTPAELQGKSFAQIDREPAHDQFALGVLVFELLMEGTHPFAGLYHGPGEAPPYEQRIAVGHFPLTSDGHIPYTPKPTAPAFTNLYPGLQHLFVRCFQDGHFQPKLRPDAQSWQWLLEEAESRLVSCWNNPQHVYGDHLTDCPWCQRTQLLGGRDPFPSPEAVRQGQHLLPPRSNGRTRKGAGVGRGQPPVPPPIPPSSSTAVVGKARRRRPLLGDWNDWAWLSLICGVGASGAGLWWSWRNNLAAYGLGMVAIILGAMGEAKSRLPELSGEGQWLARMGIALGILNLALVLRGLL